MIEKHTLLNRIEIEPNGVVQFRLERTVSENGVVVASSFHRSSITPGTVAKDHCAMLNEHIATLGWAPVAESDIARLSDICVIVHTPECIAAFSAALAESEPI